MFLFPPAVYALRCRGLFTDTGMHLCECLLLPSGIPGILLSVSISWTSNKEFTMDFKAPCPKADTNFKFPGNFVLGESLSQKLNNPCLSQASKPE